MLLSALQENWRCLYLGSPDTLAMIDQALAERGVNTTQETNRGALVLSADRSHLAGGTFDPEAMIDGLRGLIDGAVEQGFEGLCATGDMKWELGDDLNFDRLLEYEARLEQVFRDKPLWGICQYHRSTVPARAIQDALLTHRSAYIGAALNRDNLFYIPPELLLEQPDRAKHGEWMFQQIRRVLDAERARDEVLGSLATRVAERTAELEAMNRRLKAFTHSVSHDLRAPLRAIGAFADLLNEEYGPAIGEQGREYLARTRANVDRMGRLIEGLLVLARAVQAELQHVPVDLTELGNDVVRELREGNPNRTADLIVHLGLRATGDPTLLRAVVVNLLTNAWKFTGKRARARIEFGQHGALEGSTVFFVKDNGAGFDMEHANRLFGAFQRLHKQEDFPGTGVGLAMVREIVERHGGRIWVEARPDEGATFSFTLPR
jgi:signal transduction histidine kinase